MDQTKPSGSSRLFSKFDRFQTQRSRRTIAIIYLSALVALLVETWFVDSYLPVIPLFAIVMGATFFLYGSTRGITSEQSGLLDEQQISVRNDVYRQAYMIGIIVALFGGFAISHVSDWDTAFEAGLWLSVFGFVSTLPTLIIAWNLPGEIADED
jgi:predicted MFS family arabinose efflux permease